MIELRNLSKDQPYRAFVELYEGALMKNQPSVEAVVNVGDRVRVRVLSVAQWTRYSSEYVSE